MSDDFLQRENELLGGAFSSDDAGGATSHGEFDVDKAASAFPEISLDGDIPSPPTRQTENSGFGFSLDSLTSPTLPDVKITGDDEFDQFESAFPAIETSPQVVSASTPAFAPRPQPSAGFSTPILQGQVDDEEEPEVIKKWREERAEAIRKRDEASEEKKRETIAKAQRSIDEFYDNYNSKKESQIKENK
ncbi:hypothetical protein M422DRAFT_186238, partial [Sphaerobolus stellatus SS14]